MVPGPGRFIRSRIEAWSFVFLLVFVGLVAALFYLQVFRGPHYRRVADRLHHRTWVLTAPRGTIFDRNGLPLALTVDAGSIFGDPSEIRDKQAAAASLAPILNLSPGRVEECLARRGRFAWLLRRADDDVVTRVKALKIKGIGVTGEQKRVYPMGVLAADTVGFVTANHGGAAGIEEALQRVLAGHDGRVWGEVDARGRIIPGQRRVEQPPTAGRDVVLTLDSRLQEIAETCLDEAITRWKAAAGTVLVMEPHTGEILALANRPTFDPNDYRAYPAQRWVNRAVTFAYEPGSTFKIVAISAALEEGLYKPHDHVVYCRASLPVGRRVIHCVTHGHGGHGDVDVTKLIVKSCNIGAATVGFRLGPQRLHRYLRKFGFGVKPDLGLSGQSAGSVPPADTWRDITLANIAFGQSVSVTPAQLLAAYCAIANDGVRPHPHLVKRIEGGAGQPEQEIDLPGSRVISPETARAVRKMLCGVVEKGTGTAAQIEGYQVAGKTGTAQKALPGRGFTGGKFIGSFVGFVPADNPKLAMIVILDEPSGAHYGAVVAAPTWCEVAKRSLAYLGIPPTQVAKAVQAAP